MCTYAHITSAIAAFLYAQKVQESREVRTVHAVINSECTRNSQRVLEISASVRTANVNATTKREHATGLSAVSQSVSVY
jgi:tRNA(Arg) A34 adenosine deaminase TadA